MCLLLHVAVQKENWHVSWTVGLHPEGQQYKGSTWFYPISLPAVVWTPLYFFLFVARTMSQIETPISTQPSTTPMTIAAMVPAVLLSIVPLSVEPAPQKESPQLHFHSCLFVSPEQIFECKKFTCMQLDFAKRFSRRIFCSAPVRPIVWLSNVSNDQGPSALTYRDSPLHL